MIIIIIEGAGGGFEWTPNEKARGKGDYEYISEVYFIFIYISKFSVLFPLWQNR